MRSREKTGSDRTTLASRGTETAAGGGAGLAITIVYHPDLERVGDRVLLSDLAASRSVDLSRTEPVFAAPGQTEGKPLGHDHISRTPLRLLSTGQGGVRLEVGDSGTAVAFRGQVVRRSCSFSAAQIRRGVVLELGRRVVVLLHSVTPLREVLGDGVPPAESREIFGESEGVQRVLWEIHNVADLKRPVLLRGESGTGKELVAKAIHRASPRRRKPFVAVNLAGVNKELAAAAFFGAEKGAFTGAVQRQAGYFEQARGGTLFLDEIGKAPAEVQTTLLRALDDGGEIQTVGGGIRKEDDVRIIFATDANLEADVAAGKFDAALLNRLPSYEIRIPPLRERRDDIGRLLVRFLREELQEVGAAHRMRPPAPGCKPWLPSSLVAKLADHDWPGNVRQLRNVVRQLVVGNRRRDRAEMTPAVERLLAEPDSAGATGANPLPPPAPAPPRAPADEPIQEPAAAMATSPPAEEHHAPRSPATAASPALPPAKCAPAEVSAQRRPADGSAQRRPADVTEAELREALRACRWEPATAAQRLGIHRPSIYLLIRRHGIRTAGDLSPEEIKRSHAAHGGDIARMAEALAVSELALRRRVRELGTQAMESPVK